MWNLFFYEVCEEGRTEGGEGDGGLAERIPDTVLDFGIDGCVTVGSVGYDGSGAIDADALFAVDGFAGGHVLRDKQVFFAASNEDAGVTMRLLHGPLACLSPQENIS